MIHEQVTDEVRRATPRAVSLTIKLGAGIMNLTSQRLAEALSEMDGGQNGLQSMQDLKKSGASLTSIEITEENIQSFGKYAREYNIDYALKKEEGNENNVYHVFFKSKDMDSMTCAFDEFKKAHLNPATKGVEKPSILKAIKDITKNLAQTSQDKDRVNQKDKELSL